MKIQDGTILLGCGLLLWIAGTVYYAQRGAAFLEGSALRYWLVFFASSIGSAALCVGILRWCHLPARDWASGMLLLAIPGMIGEAVVLSHFSTFMPRLQETSAGRYGALLFAAYALALGAAEVVTLRATF